MVKDRHGCERDIGMGERVRKRERESREIVK
jgi:hypothetical protein